MHSPAADARAWLRWLSEQRLGSEPVCPRPQGMLPGRGRCLPCFWKPRGLPQVLRFPFSGTAEGKAVAGPRPVSFCQPLAGGSLLELSSLPPPEPVQGDR